MCVGMIGNNRPPAYEQAWASSIAVTVLAYCNKDLRLKTKYELRS